MDTDQRIAQWEKMAAEAPDGMAYFSLGNAYRDADRLADAATAFQKAVQLDPGLSRAYQLLGQVLLKLDRKDEAGKVLTTGYKTAAEKGDVMPERAMATLLQNLGQPLPEVTRPKRETPASAAASTTGTVTDRRTGLTQAKLPDPPMKGKIGKFIYDHYGADTWREWIGQGTKVINELRLDFSNEQHQQVYEQHMLEWLGVSMEEVSAYEKSQA
ncbi:MAG: tetratricopeptide repeat protein [Phycisphaera sp.]|nr:tetratricopeptide repeat protein [Phycisphaera sp.]